MKTESLRNRTGQGSPAMYTSRILAAGNPFPMVQEMGL